MKLAERPVGAPLDSLCDRPLIRRPFNFNSKVPGSSQWVSERANEWELRRRFSGEPTRLLATQRQHNGPTLSEVGARNIRDQCLPLHFRRRCSFWLRTPCNFARSNGQLDLLCACVCVLHQRANTIAVCDPPTGRPTDRQADWRVMNELENYCCCCCFYVSR